ncbi:hypothetical protein [Hymenobacter negativus]|uniref:Uncharacterized protein n=1 Tax=Hymenobacter negativus TaxID=2795026 RepID=A0ABS3QLU2_9BACT|nr:hypothetical protein [Hymenobacter negativus]MBO2011739.1 hypothetical protein [Hymenobacter negativus]
MISTENIEILKLVASINSGEAVGLRSIDMRLMRTHPAIIQNGELLIRVRALVDDAALIWKQENNSVLITEKGKDMLLKS